jgi:hypothetical protein
VKRHVSCAFGAGLRMCLGVDVAWTVMRGAVADLHGECESRLEIVGGWNSGRELVRLAAEVVLRDRQMEGRFVVKSLDLR